MKHRLVAVLLAMFALTVALAAGQSPTWRHDGLQMVQTGQWLGLLEHCDNAGPRAPSAARVFRTMALMRLGREKEALAFLREAYSRGQWEGVRFRPAPDPFMVVGNSDPYCYFMIGYLEAMWGDQELARKMLAESGYRPSVETFTSAWPDASTREGLAATHLVMAAGFGGATIQVCHDERVFLNRLAAKIAPESGTVRLELARDLLWVDRREEAKTELREALMRVPEADRPIVEAELKKLADQEERERMERLPEEQVRGK